MNRVIIFLFIVLTGCATVPPVYYVHPTGDIVKDDGRTWEHVDHIPQGAEAVHVSFENAMAAGTKPKPVNCTTRVNQFGIANTRCR